VNDKKYSRRLAAVLCADVKGYTRLMAAAEEDVHRLTMARLDLFRTHIASFHGRIVNIAGDGVLAEFSSVVSAVEFAVDIQRRLLAANSELPENRRVEFRVGINLGEVIVDGDHIFGDCVNVAERLQQFSEANGICISQDVYYQVRNKLSYSYTHLGKQRLKNISDPIDVYGIQFDTETDLLRPAVRIRSRPLVPPIRPSVAVMPFANLSGHADQDYLSDGIAEDIIVNLAKFRELFVIARNSSFTFKGRTATPQQIGSDLGVRYLLEGSVRPSEQRVRITADLVDARTGREVWGERYDRSLGDIFAIQDEVTQLIVATLVGEIDDAELRRIGERDAPDLEAYGFFLRGQQAFYRYSRESNVVAQHMYRKAIELDPGFSRAYAALSRTYHYDWQFSWSESSAASLDRACELAREAVATDDLNARAHAELGFVYLFQRQYEKARLELQRGLALNPNDADTMAELSAVEVYSNPERALELIRGAMRLNPHYPDWYLWYLGDAYYGLKKYQDVVDTIELMRNPTLGRRLLAASYAHLGKLEEARWQAERILAADPNFSIAAFVAKLPEIDAETGASFIEGLHKAGLPE
jgi:TolB-like protein/lipopolysaccharide biosynthesis regulator YciM